MVLAVIGVIVLLAFLVESLTEYAFGRAVEHIPALQPWSWCLAYVAMAVGIAGAWVYRFDLMYLIGQALETTVPVTGFGITITGMAIGRGANYIHDLVSRFFAKPGGA